MDSATEKAKQANSVRGSRVRRLNGCLAGFLTSASALRRFEASTLKVESVSRAARTNITCRPTAVY